MNPLASLCASFVPAKIVKFTAADLQHSFILKKQLCECKPHRHLCKKCKKIQSHLLKSYHSSNSYEEELATRLLYEFLFQFISLNDIKSGTWKFPCIRDHGHHLRIVKIANKCRIHDITFLPNSSNVHVKAS